MQQNRFKNQWYWGNIRPLQLKNVWFNGLKTWLKKTKDWYTYGEDKEENKRQKPVFGMLSVMR
jgi:hypothetical protein